MAVEYRAESRYWYGRWQRAHRRYSKRLRVQVVGKPGSDEFEQSRQEAEAALAEVIAENDRNLRPEELVQSVHELKFGKRIGSIPLNRLASEWESLPRKRALSKGRITFGQTTIGDFVAYLQKHHPKAKELAAVTAEMAEGFMRRESDRGVSGRTYNAKLSLLRGAFERLRVRAGMLANPFRENLLLRDENSIHRKPFSVEELDHLFCVAEKHDVPMYRLITVGACTALRRGDACCLKWADVDLQSNSIRVATRKTGQPVLIPLLPRLKEVLLNTPRTESPYVFPNLAQTYLRDPAEIGKQLARIFALAGFGIGGVPSSDSGEKPVIIDIPDEEDLRPKVLQQIELAGIEVVSPRVKAMIVQVYDLYSSGLTLPDIAAQLNVSKGSVSNHLARIEKIVGHPIVRKDVKHAREAALFAGTRPATADTTSQPSRLRRVNDRGFHSLRATFATIALTSGIPVEVLRIITGHSLTETVLRHYFNPHKNTVLKTVEAAMPRMLTGAPTARDPKAEALALVDQLTAHTVTEIVPKLREAIAAL